MSLYFFFIPKNASVLRLYFGYAMLPVMGLGNMPVTWTQVIGLWFVRNRGLALSIALLLLGRYPKSEPRMTGQIHARHPLSINAKESFFHDCH